MATFLALTPYHILLSIISAKQKPQDSLIIIDESGNLSNYQPIGEKFFHKSRYIKFTEKGIQRIIKYNRITNPERIRKILLEIKSIQKEKDEPIYVFNDSCPLVQVFIQNSISKIVYIEDGSAPYNDHQINNTKIKILLHKIAYGWNYESPSILGTSSKVAESVLTFPGLARAENRIKPIHQFICKENKYKLMKDVFNLLNNASPKTLSAPSSSEGASLILLPKFSTSSRELLDELIFIANRNLDTGRAIYLKGHPLTAKPVPSEEKMFPIGCTWLAPEIPSEILPAALPEIDSIIGPPSTSLLAAKFLYPNLSVYAKTLKPKTTIQPGEFEENLHTAGIRKDESIS